MDSETISLDFTERLLRPLRASTAPLLVWHGPDGERVELSGRVVDNWVAKSANLLAEEFDCGPGTSVALEAPPHWKSVALALAVWHTGARLVIDGSGHPDLVLASSAAAAAERWPDADLAAVALGALSLRYDDGLPPGALDYSAEVRAFGDHYLADPVDGSSPALAGAVDDTSYAELFGGAGLPGGTALWADPGTPGVLGHLLRTAVGLFGAGVPLVLLGAGVTATERLLTGERVERDCSPGAASRPGAG
ncbi:TIGR03089 family protein [Zafaria sp. Z1313]|uniref:TIGR03089 family protein n=1 Tax=unclassified Zafaria TaxID=2828765 RepID=UPI002E77D6A7|nr:TIGR03089 family protein [Zafaria sp. J156]MEE1619945.1 TIGR03089 family protein [Zafaria sp. J156]